VKGVHQSLDFVAQVIKFHMMVPNMLSKIIAAFFSSYIQLSAHQTINEQKCQRKATHTDHDKTASLWYGTCFMSPLGTWNIEVAPGFLEKLSTPTPEVL
jgi:putative copper export protein